MPTRIFFNSKNSIVVSESLDEVIKLVDAKKEPMDTIVFYDHENRYSSDRRVVVIAHTIDYFKPERGSI